jgi:hypothetical protein
VSGCHLLLAFAMRPVYVCGHFGSVVLGAFRDLVVFEMGVFAGVASFACSVAGVF